MYADVTCLIMLTLVRSNTLRIQEIDGNFSVISFPKDLFPKKTPVPYYDNIDLPELLQIVKISYLIQGSRIQWALIGFNFFLH